MTEFPVVWFNGPRWRVADVAWSVAAGVGYGLTGLMVAAVVWVFMP